ncbi:MAG TPA: iron-sulfur cluster repair di-iron protein [Kofleriaceae bacterium]|nr:iron-sulfur cluster repair di-iron protein [Kofleriaceae bacterium]
MQATTETSLGDLAAAEPSAPRVLLRHRLDFCCGGKRTLAQACATAGLDAGAVLAELAAEAARGDEGTRWEQAALADLADHLEAHYHAALRRDLPALLEAARRVERVHAQKPAVPAGLADLLAELLADLLDHMAKEERILFPAIRRGGRGPAVYLPIRVLEAEHDAHGARLARIRELTGDLEAPPYACTTWRALYAGLVTLEAELMQHIHLENHILFARAALGG